jgi:lipid A 3-O-deacylase
MPRTAYSIAGLLAFAATPAFAGELMLGVYQHDIMDGISHGGHYEHGKDIVAGYRTTALDELSFIWKPRIHFIAAVNTLGGTNFAAAGLSWRFNFAGDRFYFEPGIGAAIHTGRVNLPSPFEPGLTPAEQQKRLNDWHTKLDLGSRVLFEPELSLGWRATERIAFELSWIHMSHAQLAGPQNPGLGDFGIRAAYRFGADRGSSDSSRASDDPPARGRLPVNRFPEALASNDEPTGPRLPVNRPDEAPSVASYAQAASAGERIATLILEGSSSPAEPPAPIPPARRTESSVVRGSVVHRAVVGRFEDPQSAEAFCANLRSTGQACVVRTEAPPPGPKD